ncbi:MULTISPECIES: NupC/NupG family nucleoside CNT transporter [Roseivirga]|uniref:Na+ dependent nucleoside transporter domain-containing protein n=1 Tax=Roseivirga spongicola TaxID=333140 RepID=A0A150X3I4_9BACT|nr:MULTISPECIES: nucleoside transporter C-terminal domain-containing protein [Roseivirga]KYG73274.1 Na+ dependent nucleoside transporter domain-containing protein [Roseivirga spongicola]MBO6497460.1 NupC/NupG family nucleoside CNT transporter [Roseivirga sp.]MBO6659495.1 NupC/NupG family nucleoside CNT transporter [Roseivirga sp.]MBO6762517.1 NupC/NupG family nucleoside CNT transporter [Roseivirga sp.]MBO6907768.1 NupC/NupG family nucleoside CNT transporter [Roseivirga sp.]
MDILRAVFGLAILIGIAYLLSGNKKKVSWRLVGVGITLQIIIALLISYVPIVQSAFRLMSEGFVTFLNFALDGAEFLYGDLARNSDAVEGTRHSLGFLFVFQALPTVIFFSAITAGLYYLGILQKIVYVFAWIMAKTMRLSGAESMSAAGNVFLGQTEAPLLVKPFIGKMTKSELLCLMTGGMATIAGSVLGAYVSFLGGGDPEQQAQFATYLLSASIMNAPAAILMAKIFLPETEEVDEELKVSKDQIGANVIDALAGGASDGLKLAANIGAMLLAFIAVIYTLNWVLVDGIGEITGLNAIIIESTNGVFDGLSLQYILGQIFRVFAFAMGVDWNETLQVGSLIGQKTVINEFVAYLALADMKADGLLSQKAIIISTYALCGFANFSSIAIQIGGIGGMAPERQGDLSKLGVKALMAATLATMMTATIAGALFG